MAVQKLASMTAPLPETSFQPRRCLQRRCSCIHSRTAASAAETARSASAAGRRSTAACPSCCAFCWPSVLCCRMGDSDSSVAWHATPLHLLVELLSDDLRDLLRLLLILRNLSSAGSWRFRRCRRFKCPSRFSVRRLARSDGKSVLHTRRTPICIPTAILAASRFGVRRPARMDA